MFPDSKVMDQIKAAFEADRHITSDYKNNIRVSLAGTEYIVIANNTKFVAVPDGGGWQFRNVGLAS